VTSAALTRLSDVEPEAVSWLWPGRIPVGKLVTLDGDPGVGKSTLALTFAATVTTGGDWPDGTRCELDGDVLVMSAEDGLGDTIRPRLNAAGADCTRVHALDGQWVTADDGTRTLATVGLHHGALLLDAITNTNARLLIVDVMMAYLGNTNSYRDQDMRAVLTPLADIATETGCTVLLLRHPPKGPQTKAIHAGGGSIGIIGAARVGLLAVDDPDDDETRVLTVSKNNLAPVLPSLAYRLESVVVGEVDTSVVRWMGEHRASATELVTRAPEDNSDTAVVLALVNARPKMTAHDVNDLYPHITLDTARRILSRLNSTGKIDRPTRGVYCPVVRLSGSEHSPSSSYVSESDIKPDKPDNVSEVETDNRTVSETVSDSETTNDQVQQQVSDNRTTGQGVVGTIHSPDPGHVSISSPEGDATIESAGVGRPCRTEYCGGTTLYRHLCRDCIHREQADALVTSVRARNAVTMDVGVGDSNKVGSVDK